MPVVLNEAKIGAVVRPPKTGMYSLNGHLLRWETLYEVTRKDPKNRSVWLNPHPCRIESTDGRPIRAIAGTWCITVTSAQQGSIQVDEDAVWLAPNDPKPSDGVRIFKAGEAVDDSQVKRRRGGPDTKYVFAFDDHEISLDDMPAQAQILADIMLEVFNSTGANGWTEKEIGEILRRDENVEKLKTKQDPLNIFKFYRAEFARKNFVSRED